MLLALRSLWESVTETCRGAGLLLSLSSLVNECAGEAGDVVFNITGVAAAPAIGEITQVDGTEEQQASGGILPFLIARAAKARKPRKVSFAVRGVAANPQVGEISSVDISVEISEPSRAPARSRSSGTLVHIDFSVTGAGKRAPISRIHSIGTDFAIVEGVIASPAIDQLAGIETAFDLLEEEWFALLLAA